jgi:hypothetical protein
MKNLVFTALMLGGLMQATGCIIESSDDDAVGEIHAQWTLVERLATDPPADNVIDCSSAGVATIAMHSLPVSDLDCDPDFGGTECVDLFDCVDGNHHTDPLFADTYTVWMEALDANNELIAISFSEEVTVSGGDDREVNMLWPVDVGNYDLTWNLVDTSDQPLTCAEVGSDGVEIIATPVLNQETFTSNIFNCEDGAGLAIDNALGDNTIVVSILEEGTDASLGDSLPREETLAVGNEVVDIGNFEFVFN